MSVISTAEIIPFPVTRNERSRWESLDRSMAKLQAAAAEQRVAVAAWREQIEQLRGNFGNLAASFSEYNAGLEAAKQDMAAIGREARRLEAWADRSARRNELLSV